MIELRDIMGRKVCDVPLPFRTLLEFKVQVAIALKMKLNDPSEIRLVYKRKELQSCHDIDDDDNVVHVVLALRGRAMVPKNSMEDPFLSSYYIEAENLKEDVISSLRRKSKEEGVNVHQTYSYQQHPGIFKKCQRRVICNFMDDVSEDIVRDTVHLEIGVDQLQYLLSAVDDDVCRGYKSTNIRPKMNEVFQGVYGCRLEWKIILTTIWSSSENKLSAIDFHCQSMDNTSTSQITLNSDYVGGTMYFFVNDKLQKIGKHPGSLVSYPPKVLSGVSEVTEGEMKFLRVVDKCNNLREEDIIIPVTWEQVMAFVNARNEGDESDTDSTVEMDE